MWTILLTILHVIACVFLVVVVLLQTGKGTDVNAVFGGSSQTIFGSSGAGNFLTRLTTATAIVFMLTSLILTYGAAKRTTKSVFDEAPASTATPVTPEKSPIAPSGENAPPSPSGTSTEKSPESGSPTSIPAPSPSAASQPAEPAPAAPVTTQPSTPSPAASTTPVPSTLAGEGTAPAPSAATPPATPTPEATKPAKTAAPSSTKKPTASHTEKPGHQ